MKSPTYSGGALLFFALLSCLYTSPAFGQKTVGLCYLDSLAAPGYTLFAPNNSKRTYLIDNCGREVHSWLAGDKPRVSAYLTDEGNLVRTRRVASSAWPGGAAGGVEIYDWDNNLLWESDYTSADYNRHHDIEPLPNGNILLLAYEIKTPAELEAAGRDLFYLGAWYETIIEIEPVGTDTFNIVWEWRMWDHLVQDFDSTKPNFGSVSAHPERIDLNYVPNLNGPDWVHANSVDYNEDLDQIMIGARNFHEIWVIDHSTTTAEAASSSGGNSGKGGDLLYRWGNPATYGRGDTLDQKLWRQHDCRWIEAGYPDAGKMMCFSNGLGRYDGDYSTIDVIDPPVDAAGNYTLDPVLPFGPDTFYWQYKATDPFDFYSRNMAGAMQLQNGNYLICSTQQGVFFEVDQAGNKHWEYICPVNNLPIVQGDSAVDNLAFRAERYTPDFAGFAGRDLTPGDPVEINPIPYTCPLDAPPITCNPPINLTATAVGPGSVGLSWDGGATDLKYQLQGRLLGTSIFRSRTSVGNSKLLNGLPSGTTFEWKVRALCGDSSISAFSSLETFTTTAPKSALLSELNDLRDRDLDSQAKVYSLNGQLLATISLGQAEAVELETARMFEQLPTGLYLVQLITGGETSTELRWLD